MNVKYKDMHIHNKIKSVNSADTCSVCGSPCRSSSYFCNSVRLVRAFSSYCRYPPTNEAEYCDERVCLSICLSVRSCWPYLRTNTSKLRQIFVHVDVAVARARSSSGGVAIRYVLPVSWMTSC